MFAKVRKIEGKTKKKLIYLAFYVLICNFAAANSE